MTARAAKHVLSVMLACALLACARDRSAPVIEQVDDQQPSSGGAPAGVETTGGMNGGGPPEGGAGGTPASGGSGGSPASGGSTSVAAVDASTSAPIDSGASSDAASMPAAEDASTEPHPSFVGCRGPFDPGCAACKEGEDSYRRADEGVDWYQISSSDAPCAPDCPPCASCTYDEEENLERLGVRADCLPCTEPVGTDPCFMPNSCRCYCQRYSYLTEDCPAVLP